MDQPNLSGAWRGVCHPRVLGRENDLQRVPRRVLGLRWCQQLLPPVRDVTLPLPMGSRNSWSTFRSNHNSQHLFARAVEMPTLDLLPSLPGLQLPQLQGFVPTLVPPLRSVVLFRTLVRARYMFCWQRWAGKTSAYPIT